MKEADGVLIRDLTESDLPRVLELNNAAVPAVGRLDAAGLAALVADASLTIVAVDEDAGTAVTGVAIAFAPGAAYASPNYRWFAARLDDFCYLDRIMVDPSYHRSGIGSALYDEVERRCDAAVLTCEVNVRPRNDGSLAFHARRGFAEVGTQDTDGGAKTVSLLQKPLARPA